MIIISRLRLYDNSKHGHNSKSVEIRHGDNYVSSIALFLQRVKSER
jgi:hypothetical protein